MAFSLSIFRLFFSSWVRRKGVDWAEDWGFEVLCEQKLQDQVSLHLCFPLSTALTQRPQVCLHICKMNQEVGETQQEM